MSRLDRITSHYANKNFLTNYDNIWPDKKVKKCQKELTQEFNNHTMIVSLNNETFIMRKENT